MIERSRSRGDGYARWASTCPHHGLWETPLQATETTDSQQMKCKEDRAEDYEAHL